MNQYLNELKIEEFSILLNQFHIDIDDCLKEEILNIIKNNQYALINDEYQSVIENCIKKLTSEHTCQKFNLLFNNHFKPLLKV
jgi:hypothetical protein